MFPANQKPFCQSYFPYGWLYINALTNTYTILTYTFPEIPLFAYYYDVIVTDEAAFAKDQLKLRTFFQRSP